MPGGRRPGRPIDDRRSRSATTYGTDYDFHSDPFPRSKTAVFRHPLSPIKFEPKCPYPRPNHDAVMHFRLPKSWMSVSPSVVLALLHIGDVRASVRDTSPVACRGCASVRDASPAAYKGYPSETFFRTGPKKGSVRKKAAGRSPDS